MIMAFLGSTVIFYALSAIALAVYVLSMYFSHWLETGVFEDGEIPTIWLIGLFCGSFLFIYVGYLLGKCWRFVTCIGLAALFTLSGLGIIPGGMNWDESILLQSIPGVALFIFAYYKRDALRYVEPKRPDESNA
jgi:hypothetical protein